MNFTSEEFRDSDEAWLAENVFSQLKDFNTIVPNNEIEKSSNTIKQTIELNNLSETSSMLPIICSETNNEHNKLIDEESGHQNPDSILKHIKIEAEFSSKENVPEVNQFIISNDQFNYTNLENDLSNFRNPKSNSEGIPNQENENQQYFEVMMSLPDIFKTDDMIVINELATDFGNNDLEVIKKSPVSKFIKCMNCLEIFRENSFMYHICEYDFSNQNLLPLNALNYSEPLSFSSLFHPSNKTLRESLIRQNKAKLPLDPPCIRQLRENLGKIRKFIKDELKIDLVSSNEKKLDGPHECTLCERKFVHASGLARHMEKHAMDLIPSTNPNLCTETNQLKVMIKCLVCGRLFFKIKDAMGHLFKNHQEDKPPENFEITQKENFEGEELTEEFVNLLIEKENQKNFESKEGDSNHQEYLDAIIVNDVLQCEFCEFIFSDCSHLLLHSSYHDPNSGFECISCEIQVPTSKDIFLHWQAECVFARELIRDNFIIKRFYTCNVCENKFSSMEQLTDHRYATLHFFPRRKRGLRILQIGCEYCGCIFDKIEYLVRHREEKHLKKLIEKKGVNIQSNELGGSNQKLRQYLCDICGKSYTQSSHLWQHLRFHRGVKPFACKEPNCDRSFTIRPDLNDHIRKCHTGERPYQCQVCGKRFLTGSVYYQHRLIHRGDRRYACEECGKRFYRADALKNHQRIHTGEKPYGCLYCTKNFRQRGDRDKHIRARHSNLDENAKNVLTALKNGQMPPPAFSANQNFLSSIPSLASSLSPEFETKQEDLVFVGNTFDY